MTALVPALAIAACAPDGTLDLLPILDGGEGGTACHPLDACSAECVDVKRDPRHCGVCGRACAQQQWCNAGQCECLPGYASCNGSCVDLRSDPDHCGHCAGSVCPAANKCEMGTCGTGGCMAGSIECPVSGRVACVSHTLPYCLACGVVCAVNEVCTPGGCRRYAPATPCTTCPCTTECARAIGNGAVCCSGLGGLVCVEGGVCP